MDPTVFEGYLFHVMEASDDEIHDAISDEE
jgi:hypothetical protein